MTRHSALVATAAGSMLLLATILPAQTSEASTESPGVSKVRIVRLSEVKGQVQLDRNNGRGYEPGIANLPIVEKSRLQTDEGVAEVEFEDNSTLRVAPNSEVEFPRLERQADGTTVSSVHLLKGMAYVSLLKGRNQFHLLFGEQDVTLSSPSHIRLQMEGTEARLAVLDGTLRIEGTSGMMDVPKKKTVTFDLLEHQKPALAKDVLPEPYDEWDQTATGYHARVANASAFNGSPYSYGLNDMMYYGNFVDAGGCGMGMMWRPYFASAAWDPYANGVYAYYQGAGYSWVSPYPWGWTPYHYGSWNFCPGMGWGWQPGGAWTGLNNIAFNDPTMNRYQGASGGVGGRPPAPVHPPAPGSPTMFAVSSKPLVRSEVASPESFVFRKDSAGLGVPRDAFGKLEKFSQHTAAHGTVSERIYMSAPASAMGPGRPTSTMVMAGSMHRGSPPAAAASSGPYAASGASAASRSSAPTGYSNSMPASNSMPSSHTNSASPSGGTRPH